MVSDAKLTCAVSNDGIKIPKSLFSFLGAPVLISLISSDEGKAFFIKRHSCSDVFRHRMMIFLGSMLKKKTIEPLIAKLKSVNNGNVAYTPLFKYKNNKINKGEYHIVNYETTIYFIPVDQEEASSRQKAWASMHDYHEHRKIIFQDRNAIKVSEWLPSFFKQFNPKSILEIGCGAGRNLLIARKHLKQTKLIGIDINKEAIEIARNVSDNSIEFHNMSLYELSKMKDKSIDIVFTAGVLMHVPHEKVIGVIKEIHRIANKAVIHFELHGPSNDFDYHRYPRDYKELYEKNGLGNKFTYEVFPANTFQSAGTNSFNHSLLIFKK